MKCAYARVSTQQEIQEQSYEAQQRYYREMGIDNIYADKETATSINRTGFKDMLFDCGLDIEYIKTDTGRDKLIVMPTTRSSKYSYIYCKSITRFSRDIQGAVDVIRELKSKNVYCRFEQENIDTKDTSSDFLMNIMLSMSQQESTNISERVKWGNKRSMEQGVFRGHNLYGYNYNKATKEVTINEEEAEIVRFIYNSRLENKGSRRIANELNSKNIKTKSGANFSANTVNGILQNKTYCGYVRRNVCKNEGFGDTKTRKNIDKSKHVLIKSDNVPVIISEEIFEKVQELISEFRDNYRKIGKNITRDQFKGKIKCGKCKKNCVRVGNFYVCLTKHKQGKKVCDSKNLSVKLIDELVTEKASKFREKAIEKLPEYYSYCDNIIEIAEGKRNTEDSKKLNDNILKIEEYNKNIDSLLELMLEGAGAERVKNKIEMINKEILLLEKENSKYIKNDSKIDDIISRAKNLKNDLKQYMYSLPEKMDKEEYINKCLDSIFILEIIDEYEELTIVDTTDKYIDEVYALYRETD